jgi:hypothetical protein
VSNIRKDSTFKTPKWTLDLTSSSDVTTQQTYNHVILAAPFPSTPAVEYVDLHVTIVTTTGSGPRSGYFNMKESETLPIDILTTNEGVRHGGKAPEFNSLTSLPGTYIGVEKDGSIVKERAFKIFSLDEKSDEWLENVFGEGNLRWVFRHQVRHVPRSNGFVICLTLGRGIRSGARFLTLGLSPHTLRSKEIRDCGIQMRSSRESPNQNVVGYKMADKFS